MTMTVRKTALLAALTAALMMTGCSQNDDPVLAVQEGVTEENLSLPIGKALAAYEDCQKDTALWQAVKNKDGKTLVEFSCRLDSAKYGWTEGRLATAMIVNRDNSKEIVTLLSSAGGMKVADRAVLDKYNAELDALTALPREEQFERAKKLVADAKVRIAGLRDKPEEGLYLRNVFLNTLVNRIETLFAVSDDLEGDLVLKFAPEVGSDEKVTLEGAFLRAVWPERKGEFSLDERFVLPRIYQNVPIVNNASIYPLAEKLQPNKGNDRIIFVDREN